MQQIMGFGFLAPAKWASWCNPRRVTHYLPRETLNNVAWRWGKNKQMNNVFFPPYLCKTWFLPTACVAIFSWQNRCKCQEIVPVSSSLHTNQCLCNDTSPCIYSLSNPACPLSFSLLSMVVRLFFIYLVLQLTRNVKVYFLGNLG